MLYVLFYSFFCGYVIFLFNSLHPSDQSSVQKSSAQPFVTGAVFDSISESEQSASLASLASLKSIASVIMAGMASAFQAAQDAAAISADHPGAQDDVSMLSADPILIVNSQDRDTLVAAHVRTEIAMSNLTISGHSAPDSSSMPSWPHCHHRGWTCVICQRMASTSHQASREQVRHLTSRGSWRPRISAIGSSSTMQSSSSINSIMCFRSLESRKLHQSLQDSKNHMIYLTVAHCIRHGSPASSADFTIVYTIMSGIMVEGHLQHFEEGNLSGMKSLNLKQQALGHLRLSSLTDEIQIMRSLTSLDQVVVQASSCQVMLSTMNQCQYVIDS